MAAVGFKAAGSGLWKGNGAGLQLAAAVFCQSCSSAASSGPGEGRRAGWGQQRAQHQSAGQSPPQSVPGRARRAAEPSPAAGSPLSSQPSPAEGADTKSYLWARYHEMKKLVYGKNRLRALGLPPPAVPRTASQLPGHAALPPGSGLCPASGTGRTGNR